MKILFIDGKEVLLDDEDYLWISEFKWRIDGGYATTGHNAIRMHRILLRAHKGVLVDHVDRNPLNNQKINLRVASALQNAQNRSPRKCRISKYKGIHKVNGKWRVRIQVNGERIHIGYYDNDLDAARAYDKAAKHYFKEFAYLNFKESA